ncbi:hypothetical protein NDI85_14460 [Halomicroarcula sp. S1AR25-4]|uniref:hypothetical protein n=1 Tax=Haloarcula sp. S1AR25-4 TaxID=2950538 RepID=UPI002874B8E1|nr:hypothetical protein [Halomicroarcula sp. S1AR25-4]MDS0279000.1 hypothetical protein [Halomicroarcula sp. S1AR25-4]
MRSHAVAVLLCLSILVSAPSVLATESQANAADDVQSMDVRYVVDRLPEQVGRVQVTAVVDVPDRVSDLSVRTPTNTTVLSADGLASTGSRWRWDGSSNTVSVTYTVPVGLRTAYGQRTADTAEWALVVRREVALHARWRWQAGPDPGWNETMAVAAGQRGVGGETAVFVGPHETITRTTPDGTVRLVVPDAATLEPDPVAVLDTIGDAQRSTTIGDAHDAVTILVTPNSLAVGGYTPSNGAPVALVNAGERVGVPTNVWVHEYRHTRQTYRTSAGMAWLEEGSADYYAARMTYQQGRIDYDRYRRRVTTDRYRDADLTRPSTWSSPDVQYDKGTRVVAALDVHIRQATDGERTFATVLRRLSRSDERLTLSVFAETVSAVAGQDLDAFVRQAVTGPAPSVPADPDGDGVSTHAERQRGTDPYRATMGDGSDDRTAARIDGTAWPQSEEQLSDDRTATDRLGVANGSRDGADRGTPERPHAPLPLWLAVLAVWLVLTGLLWRDRPGRLPGRRHR